MAYRDWEDEARPWTAMAGEVSRSMMQLPVIRAQLARQRAADAEAVRVNDARIRNMEAETGQRKSETAKTDEETRRLARVGLATERLQKNFPRLVGGDFASLEANEALGDLAVITGENKDDLGRLLASVASTRNTMMRGPQATPQDLRHSAALNNPNTTFTTETGNTTRMAIARAGIASREKIARERPITVSRDAGVWNPAKQEWDVPKPDRPPGNPNNLYDPATRRVLESLGEQLAAEIAEGSTNAPNTQLKINEILGQSRSGAGSALPERPVRMKQLDKDTAKTILQEAGGDKEKARELARQRGYSF